MLGCLRLADLPNVLDQERVLSVDNVMNSREEAFEKADLKNALYSVVAIIS